MPSRYDMVYCIFCDGSLQADWVDTYNLDVYKGIKVSEIIVRAPNCDLCAMIVRRLKEDNLLNVNDGIVYRTKGDFSHLASIGNLPHLEIRVWPPNPGTSGPVSLEKIVRGQPRVILELQPYHDHGPARSYNMLESSSKSYGTGRLLGVRAHLPLLSQWIKSCRDTHGESCSHPILPPTSTLVLQSLLVIDVETMSLVEAPPKCRYVALSYCWGQVPVVRHLKSKSAALREENVFRRIRLPNTIADAIEVVRGVGERYLWVDALCIMQDDPKAQQIQLAQMGKVYSAAAFTIVAAAGNNADSGLPGIRDGSRSQVQEVFQIAGKQFISVIDGDYYGGYIESEWSQRAWTMQEDVLSKKRLIFTKQQIYWSCWSASWLEETYTETKESIFDHIARRRQFGYDFSHLDGLGHRYLYSALLNSYLQRQLTFSKDILNAFSGICEAFSAISCETFFWGLPESSFSEAICWTLQGERKRNFQSCVIYDSQGFAASID